MAVTIGGIFQRFSAEYVTSKTQLKDQNYKREDYKKSKDELRKAIDNAILRHIEIHLNGKISNPKEKYTWLQNTKHRISNPLKDAKKWNLELTLPILEKAQKDRLEELKSKLSKENPDLEALDNKGNTPLMISLESLRHGEKEEGLLIKSGDPLIATLLLDFGANPLIANGDGNTPLHLLANAREGKAHRLLKRFLSIPGTNCDAVNNNGETPFYLAIDSGNAQTAQLFMEKGADVSMGKNRDMHTVLHRAVRGDKCVDFIPIILKKNPQLHQIINKNQQTPLDNVMRYQHSKSLETARILIDAGANVNCCDWEDYTPLHHAVQEVRWDLVELLLESGADPTAEAKDGVTPFSIAGRDSSMDHAKILELLENTQKSL